MPSSYHKEREEVTRCEKPARPGHDPDARIDAEADGCIPTARVPVRPAHADGTFGASGLDGPGDDLHLHDAWLVEHARHGDHQAFAVLVRRYERKLIRVLMRLVHEPEQARDLAQETFWRVYTRLDRFDTARRFGPWLFRVGVNLGLDWLRSTKSTPPAAASIDRTDADGQAVFELSDPDPRDQADLVAGSSVCPGTDAGQLPDDPRTPRPGRLFLIGSCGDCRSSRGDRAVAVGQGPGEIPRDLGAPPGWGAGSGQGGSTR